MTESLHIHQQQAEELQQDWLLMRGLNELRQGGALVDVILVVSDEKLMPCHRAVLAASSPYFRAMFTHDVSERNKTEIEIKGLDASSVSSIVDYMYSKKVVINDDNVQNLLTACSMLQVVGLYGKCRRYMQRRLSVHNCIDVYSFAKTLCCTELQNDAFALITRSFTEISSSLSFLNLNKDDLIDFISADELLVEKEEVVYEAVLSWLLHDIKFRGMMIGEIFSHVRMALLNEDYLNDCLVQETALMGFSNLRSQILAAQTYKANLKDETETTKKLSDFTMSENKTCFENNDENSIEKSDAVLIDAKLQENATIHCDEDKDNPTLDKIQPCDLSVTECAEFLISDRVAKKQFLQFPYYEVNVDSSNDPVKIPLTVAPRAGMSKTDILLFTNGRKTILFDPYKHQYLFNSEETYQLRADQSLKDVQSRCAVKSEMPIMKSPEVFASERGFIYLIGGLEVEKQSSSTSLRSKLYVFDVERLTWTPRASLREPRCMTGMGEFLGNFFVTGGKALSRGQILSCVQQYNFDDDVWTESTEMLTPLYGHGCASVKNKLFVLGGKTSEKEIVPAVTFLSGDTMQWSVAPSLNVPRFLTGVTVLKTPLPSKQCPYKEVIYVVGGVSSEGLLASVETIDINEFNRWIFSEDFPGNRCAQTVTTIDRKVCVVGGHVTERNESGRFESIQKFDVHVLEPSVRDNTNEYQWTQIVRYIRSLSGTSCACTGLKIDPKRIGLVAS